MRLEAWLKHYDEIVKEFGYDPKKDYYSSTILSSLLGNRTILEKEIAKKINKEVYIIGNSASLSQELKMVGRPIIVADDAVKIVSEYGIIPDIILTDLDGDINTILEMNTKGTLVGIHAHGDNLHLLEKYVPKFKKNVFGTTQNKPLWNIYNFGGFTDGDRCVFLAQHFKAEKIHLIGFDFELPTRKEGKNSDVKKKKLAWAKKLIDLLKKEYGIEIHYNLKK